MKINVLLPLKVYQFILAYIDIKVSSVFIQTAAVYFILVILNRICPVISDMLSLFTYCASGDSIQWFASNTQ